MTPKTEAPAETNRELVEIVKNFGTPRILVIGDLMLDHYTYGKAERISQEAPVLALEYEREEFRLGGAANVALMCKALGADVTVAGIIGQDWGGQLITRELIQLGINDRPVISEPTRPTTVKHRFIGQSNGSQGQQVLRVDRESREPISVSAMQNLLEKIPPHAFDTILISDYAKGVCTRAMVQQLVTVGREEEIPVIADPCRSSTPEKYHGVTAITPNREELGGLIPTAYQSRIGGDVFHTQDADGIVWVGRDGGQRFPTRRRKVFDVTGAGDAVLSMVGMCYANGVSPDDAARLANIAGGLEVERLGCVSITREEVIADLGRCEEDSKKSPFPPPSREWISEKAEAEAECESISVRGLAVQVGMPGDSTPRRRVVFTNGCFDLLHPGHCKFLEAAKREGDYLIVAVNSDRCVRNLKGPGRPIIPEQQRVAMLSALKCVDEVIVFEEPKPLRLLREIRPDVLVKGEPYKSISEVVGHEIVEAYGGEVKILAGVPGLSTTSLLSRLSDLT